MNKKLFLVMIILIGAIIGLWSWTLVVPTNSISIGGSASVQPLLKKFTNNYVTDDEKTFVYSATGSGAGITNVKNEVYEIGFISKKVNSKDWELLPTDDTQLMSELPEWTKENKDEYYNQLTNPSNFKEETYRSIELAKDSFVFVYNDKGTGFEQFLKDSKLSFTFKLNSNIQIVDDGAEILHNIYEKDNQKDLWTWQQLALYLADKSDDNVKQSNQELAKKVKTTKITPYSSTSGSGTRGSFSDLTSYNGKGITPGQAVKEYNSNGAIYGQLINSPGSIGFVSMLYGENLTKDVKAVVIEKEGQEWNLNDKENLPSDYPLTRPFISIIKMNSQNPDFHSVVNFIYWMTRSEEAEKSYKDLGLQRST